MISIWEFKKVGIVGCEEFKDNPENSSTYKCPIHQKNLEWKNEENLFLTFEISKEIEKIINESSFIEPIERKNEIINFVSRGLKFFNFKNKCQMGIPVPGYVTYLLCMVWCFTWICKRH